MAQASSVGPSTAIQRMWNGLESLNDAYIAAVKALGGSKAVGVLIWPPKGVEAAQRHLLACLNPDRNEKLSPDEALQIELMARQIGVHVVAQYRAAVLSYAEPQPIEPRDELADLLRQSIEARRESQQRDERIERLLESMEKRPGTDSQALRRVG